MTFFFYFLKTKIVGTRKNEAVLLSVCFFKKRKKYTPVNPSFAMDMKVWCKGVLITWASYCDVKGI